MMDSVVMFQGTIYEKGYGQIARAVMRDTDLKIQSKSIYGYICSFASNSNSSERTAFPSVELQCYELGISEDTYYKHRKPLIEKGYLKIEKRRGESAKFDRNLYIICAVPIPLEPEKPTPENIGDGENVDIEPFEPHPKKSGMDEPYPNSPSTVEPSPVDSGTKTTKTKTNKTKKNISLVSSSRDSDLPIYELIDKEMKKAYPNVPFDEIREGLLNDENAVINTVKQYHGMLEYRLQHYKPRKQPKRPQFKPKHPIREELLPNWFEDEKQARTDVKKDDDLTEEEKQAEIDRVLKEMREQ